MNLKDALSPVLKEYPTGGGGGGGAELPKFIDATWSAYTTAISVTTGTLAGKVQAGDLLLAFVYHRDTLTTPPAGFTLVAAGTTIDLGSRVSVYKKVATGTETTLSATQATSQRMCLSCSIFRGSTTPTVEGAAGGTIPDPAVIYTLSIPSLANPAAKSGLLLFVVGGSLAGTGESELASAYTNVPCYGWSACHNTFGTSSSNQNRMMVNFKPVDPSEVVSAYSPRAVFSDAEPTGTLSFVSLLITLE